MYRATWDYFRYLKVSKRDRQWGIYVTGVGRPLDITADYDGTSHPPPYYYRWETGRVLPEYQAWYIVRGEGEFESETTGRQIVCPGNIVLLFAASQD